MRKLIMAALVSLALLACEGSLDDSTYSWTPGIYTGNFTPTGASPIFSYVMVTSDGKALYAESDVDTVGLGIASSGTISFGATASATLTGQLSGTYNFLGTTGSFSLSDAGLSSRGSSLSTVEGVWVDSTFFSVSGVSTWTITNGTIELQTVEGCAGSGTIIPINSAYNEYSVTGAMTDCPDTSYNGNYTGLAFTADTLSENDQIFLLLEHVDTGDLVFSYPREQ